MNTKYIRTNELKYSDSNIEYSVPNIPNIWLIGLKCSVHHSYPRTRGLIIVNIFVLYNTNIEVEVIKSSANPNRGMDIVETIQIFFLLTNLNSKRSKSQ